MTNEDTYHRLCAGRPRHERSGFSRPRNSVRAVSVRISPRSRDTGAGTIYVYGTRRRRRLLRDLDRQLLAIYWRFRLQVDYCSQRDRLGAASNYYGEPDLSVEQSKRARHRCLYRWQWGGGLDYKLLLAAPTEDISSAAKEYVNFVISGGQRQSPQTQSYQSY
jgi:hypothetical protein